MALPEHAFPADLPPADAIARACLAKYASLPPRGKALGERVWTVLAGFVLAERAGGAWQTAVVSLATGTKCLGATQLARDGTLVGDSHAEVLARRGFKKFLWREIALASTPSTHHASRWLELDPDTGGDGQRRWRLRPAVSVHLYVSQTPCGDASIFPIKELPVESQALLALLQPTNQRQGVSPSAASHGEAEGGRAEDEGAAHVDKKARLDPSPEEGDLPPAGDVQRTGAKCVSVSIKELAQSSCGDLVRLTEGSGPALPEDDRSSLAGYHVVGWLRTKPGRGDRTRSMSCSDKIALWNAVGVQGSLLSLMLSASVALHSVVVGDLFNEAALARALVHRLEGAAGAARPAIRSTTLVFPEGKLAKLKAAAAEQVQVVLQGSPTSLVWTGEASAEALVVGKKEGAGSKANPRKAMSAVSKASLFQDARQVLGGSQSYYQLKQSAVGYQAAKRAVLALPAFRLWIRNGEQWESFGS